MGGWSGVFCPAPAMQGECVGRAGCVGRAEVLQGAGTCALVSALGVGTSAGWSGYVIATPPPLATGLEACMEVGMLSRVWWHWDGPGSRVVCYHSQG